MSSFRCLVIGAGSGIGKATFDALREDGHLAVGADLVSDEWVPDDVHRLGIDVADEDSVNAAVTTAEEITGGLEAVVNTAGILGHVGPSAEESVAGFERNLQVNLLGAFLVSRAVLPAMAERGYGRLVHFSSTAGKEGVAGMAAYSASKAGVLGLVKSLAREYAAKGVTVNAIAPGRIDTPFTGSIPPSPETLANIPIGRYGTPAEAASLVRWVISPAASYSTGTVYDLSGGRATY